MPTSGYLPAYFLFIFGVLEPLLLLRGFTTIWSSPQTYYTAQTPLTSNPPIFPPQAETLTLQLGNIYILLALLAIICIWTPNADVSRRYLMVVAVADVGHVLATYRGVGPEGFWDLGGWTDVMWGNVGVSVFLFVNRLATVGGAFGRASSREGGEKRT